MKYVFLALNWVFGVLFAIVGVILLFGIPLSSLPLFAIAFLLLPPIRTFVYARTGKSFSFKARAIFVFGLCLIFGLLLAQFQDHEDIDYFSANRATIISELREEYDKGNYKEAVAKAKKYLLTEDQELKEIYEKTGLRLEGINRAKKQKELLAKLKTIPATEFAKNKELYKELLAILPTNMQYREKYEYYSSKIKEKEEKQRLETVGGPSADQLPADPLSQMEIAFRGNPPKHQIKAKLYKAMELYNLLRTQENYSRAGSALVALRKEIGPSEMAILDHMIRSNVPGVKMSFQSAAGLSAAFLKAGDE